MENLIIRNNTIRRTDPEFSISLSSDTTSRSWDNVFEFTACKNVVIEGNCYDDGMKNYAVISNMPQRNLTNQDEEISVVTNSSLPACDPVSDRYYKQPSKGGCLFFLYLFHPQTGLQTPCGKSNPL